MGTADQAAAAQVVATDAAYLLANYSGRTVSDWESVLQAVLFHSNQLELSEQFDQWTGYEKSVADLTWSYAAFLSAVTAPASI